MPIFIPPYLGEEIKSTAEKDMFGILEGLKLKDCYVLHSLCLPAHRHKIIGEIDFVVICNRGIACLEIKGGRVSCQEGKWIYTDRYGEEHISPEGPYRQVAGNALSLRDALKKRFENNPHISNLLVATGVMFPQIRFTSRTEEIIPEITYDNTTEDITEYFNNVFDYWENRSKIKFNPLSQSDTKELVNFLRGSFTFIPTLSDRLGVVEKHLVNLTRDQTEIIDGLSMNDRLLIRGGAGTGKTLMATYYATELAEEGKRVLYLTFNKNLAASVKRQLKGAIDVFNIHGLFGSYVPVDVEKMKNNPGVYFDEILPSEFFEFIFCLEEDKLKEMQYDAIIMDEGQDMIKSLYLDCLDPLLKNGFKNGKWIAFYDENQNIFNRVFDEGIKTLESYSPTKFRLKTNCRNTRQIGMFNSDVSGVPLVECLKETGEEVRIVKYEENQISEVEKIVKELRRENVSLDQVVFLSPVRFEKSEISKTKKISFNVMNDSFVPKKDVPVYSTIHGFKGLDASVIVLVDTNKVYPDQYKRIFYTGISRARAMLYILVNSETAEKIGV